MPDPVAYFTDAGEQDARCWSSWWAAWWMGHRAWQARTLYQQGLKVWQDMQQLDDGIGIVRGLAGLAEVA